MVCRLAQSSFHALNLTLNYTLIRSRTSMCTVECTYMYVCVDPCMYVRVMYVCVTLQQRRSDIRNVTCFADTAISSPLEMYGILHRPVLATPSTG